MMTTFSVSWHETREERKQPDAMAPIPFRGLSVEVHSGDAIDDIEIVWAPFRESRQYLDPGDLYEIQEVVAQAIAHYEERTAASKAAIAEWRASREEAQA